MAVAAVVAAAKLEGESVSRDGAGGGGTGAGEGGTAMLDVVSVFGAGVTADVSFSVSGGAVATAPSSAADNRLRSIAIIARTCCRFSSTFASA